MPPRGHTSSTNKPHSCGSFERRHASRLLGQCILLLTGIALTFSFGCNSPFCNSLGKIRRCPVKPVSGRAKVIRYTASNNTASNNTASNQTFEAESTSAAPVGAINRPNQFLPLIQFDQRSSILIPLSSETVHGWPIGDDLNANENNLRELSDWQCVDLAFRVSPVGNEIDKHVNWLIQNRAASPGLIKAMEYQSRHARAENVARSMDVFFNLANLYSQQPTILESHDVIDAALRAVKKLRAANIPLPIDERQFDRQHLEIDEQSTVLIQQQTSLTQGLEQLLNLPSSENAIWTTTSLIERRHEFNLESELQLAYLQRGDLLAIEALASHPESVTTEQLAFLATGGSALLPAKLPLPKITSLLERIVKRKIREKLARLSELETGRRREQLTDLAETKRRIIKKEVSDALIAIETSQKILDIKREKLASLETSIRAAENAKDEIPLDAQQHLKNLLAAEKLKSEIIDKSFSIALEMNRLKRARGDYAVPGSPGK